jgi:hypothetical protein
LRERCIDNDLRKQIEFFKAENETPRKWIPKKRSAIEGHRSGYGCDAAKDWQWNGWGVVDAATLKFFLLPGKRNTVTAAATLSTTHEGNPPTCHMFGPGSQVKFETVEGYSKLSMQVTAGGTALEMIIRIGATRTLAVPAHLRLTYLQLSGRGDWPALLLWHRLGSVDQVGNLSFSRRERIRTCTLSKLCEREC